MVARVKAALADDIVFQRASRPAPTDWFASALAAWARAAR